MPVHDIPYICMRQCEPLWDAAVQGQHTAGEYDTYSHLFSDNPDECRHDNTPIGFSCESLAHTGDGTGLRIYTIVDECQGEDCGLELGEQSYQFVCPFNDLKDQQNE